MKKGIVGLSVVLLVVSGSHVQASKRVPNYPYVHSGLAGRFYVRCVPAGPKGGQGTTVLYRVQSDKDEVIDRYDWYSPDGVVLGWSPIAGKVAIMRKGGQTSADFTKQVEFSFYLGGKHLKTYTTQDLTEMGAKVSFDKRKLDGTKRADVEILGCQQIPGTNEYVFAVRLSKQKTVLFDILTGNPHVKKAK